MKISIITVSYNSEKSIKDTIDSVYSQTYQDIEYILVDGMSDDGTAKIIEGYEKKFANKKIDYKWISEKDNGIYDAINKGIKLATGEIIGILNSDDYFYDDFVIDDISKAFSTNQFDCIYGNLDVVDPVNGRVLRRWRSNNFTSGLFEKSWTPAHPTFYCKKSCYEKYGLYRTDFKIAADVELMYRFLEKNNVNSMFINRNIVTMKYGGVSNRGLKSFVTITKEMRKAFIENNGSFNLVKYLLYKLLKIRELV